jgi:hypothetical protein
MRRCNITLFQVTSKWTELTAEQVEYVTVVENTELEPEVDDIESLHESGKLK